MSVVVITGASAGVGRAVAKRFAKPGIKLALIARGEDRLSEAKESLEALGAQVLAISLDVTDAQGMFKAADHIEKELGPIDIWINNAMVTIVSEFIDMEPDEYRRVTDVCYHGFVFGTMAALRKMHPRNSGMIVQVGSALSYRGIPLQSAYCGAKHAIEGFTESIRCELLHNKKYIHINMVQLPAVNTPQFAWCKTRMDKKPQPVPPIYQPELAADAIFYAAHHPKRREVILGGRNVVIVWANKFFPGLGDKYLAKNGYQSQLTGEPIEKNRPCNLYEPVKGLFSARGSFSNQAVNKSIQLYLTKHRWIYPVVLFLWAFVIWRALS